MRKCKIIISLLIIILSVFQLCACVVRLPDPQEMSSADEAAAMGFSKGNYKSEISVGEYAFFDVKIKYDYKYIVQWSSSNPAVATVDSAGRVDALSEGEVTITASAKKASVDYEVKITKANKAALGMTTAFTDNESSVEQNKLNEDEVNLYALLVNSKSGCVTAYTYNSNVTYNIPVRAMVCSVGENMEEQNYKIDSREDWVYDDKYSYQYASYFGSLRFSSTPFENSSADTLVTSEYNKLGTTSTDGNIWLSVADAKWIYDNCNDTTRVKISETSSMPLDVPKGMILGDGAKNKVWDPTDPHAKNPYNKLTPYFEGVDEAFVAVGGTFDVFDGVVAFDTCSNELNTKITVEGEIDCNKIGTYILTYTCKDTLNRIGRADRVVQVVSREDTVA